MPTGYTAYIEDGKITTGKDFLRLCTRNFGIALSIMDESLDVATPEHFEPNEYYHEQFLNAVKKLEEDQKMTIDSAREKMRNEYAERVSDAKRLVEKYVLINEKYAKVRGEVESWVPPTEEHEGIKKFALEQINMCIVPDDMIKNYMKIAQETFDDSDEAVENYIKDRIKYRKDNVATYRKYWEKELEKTKEKNEFMDQFLKSLENI